ncbi:unnamed protein product [Acanthosepion pharaonis]|uniref:Uncharacterized protein n=1 Tax=Acanthosepion pharaonis TaxID=158019 RepID=A0A812EWD2_ACAPH|nr:unnamed protein product [Sepia pharaonis]
MNHNLLLSEIHISFHICLPIYIAFLILICISLSHSFSVFIAFVSFFSLLFRQFHSLQVSILLFQFLSSSCAFFSHLFLLFSYCSLSSLSHMPSFFSFVSPSLLYAIIFSFVSPSLLYAIIFSFVTLSYAIIFLFRLSLSLSLICHHFSLSFLSFMPSLFSSYSHHLYFTSYNTTFPSFLPT